LLKQLAESDKPTWKGYDVAWTTRWWCR